MTQELWTAVDQYFTDALIAPDDALESALQASADAGLPSIQVAANQGKFLALLAQTIGARSILEMGTLGGYSTIWLARALQSGGTMVTLEYEPKHAEVARANFVRAGLADRIDLRVGRALDLLPPLAAEARPPFDFVFIDADKANIDAYFEWAIRLTRIGGLIVVDNVVRGGAVADANSTDENVQGVQRFFDRLNREPRVTATALQTVGSKGYDGLAIALVLSK